MKERPILFSGPMVRALLDGTKTQTRRVVKMPKRWSHDCHMRDPMDGKPTDPPWPHCLFGDGRYHKLACPCGQPGDRLWVRETFQENDPPSGWLYRADDIAGHINSPWKPSIFMPRAASRISLEIVSVRVERLQEISPMDALDEGLERLLPESHHSWSPGKWKSSYGSGSHGDYDGFLEAEQDACVDGFRLLWESINGPGSWDANPYVWVVEFKKL